VDSVLGGWQLNGIVMLADGTPLTVGCFCGDRAQVGNTFNVHRMNQLRNAQPDGFETTLTRQFDTSAFVTPVLGTLGTGGRNTVRSTGQRSGDVSLAKRFRLHERAQLQFRGEFFNVLASYRYSPRFPTNNATAANFGSLLPVGGDKGDLFSPRTIQLGLRLTFCGATCRKVPLLRQQRERSCHPELTRRRTGSAAPRGSGSPDNSQYFILAVALAPVIAARAAHPQGRIPRAGGVSSSNRRKRRRSWCSTHFHRDLYPPALCWAT
jgi:hypothetical protein